MRELDASSIDRKKKLGEGTVLLLQLKNFHQEKIFCLFHTACSHWRIIFLSENLVSPITHMHEIIILSPYLLATLAALYTILIIISLLIPSPFPSPVTAQSQEASELAQATGRKMYVDPSIYACRGIQA